ncbi:MAG TPA: sulfatase [Gaiellaceae bacterium]|nr:sulfatase [Gaiellaceae bacterium]
MTGLRPRTWGVLAASFSMLAFSAALVVLSLQAQGEAAEASSFRHAQAQTRPNVLVLMTDDQTVESMRVMTNVNSLLAARGTTFVNNFASFPLCCPSRSTFITGQYAHNHTVMGNAPPAGGYDKLAPTHANTLPAWLRQAGYLTIHVGKYLNGYGSARPREIPPGWVEWYGSTDPSTYRYFNYTLNENGRLVTYGTGAANYQTDVYARKAVELIRRNAPSTQPFFLSVAFLAPHAGAPRDADDPANQPTPSPAPRHRNRFASEALPRPSSFNEADVSDKPSGIRNRALIGQARINGITENYRQRLESLLAVDEAVRDIVAALEATGELSRTLIVFTSDNGFFHGEHRVPDGKVLVYEPSVRVPLILRGPGVPAGARRTNLVANVDLAATILDVAHARPGRAQDGRSLLPFARDALNRSGRDILLETGSYSAIRTPRHVFVQHGSGEQELYDLATDPDQLQSLHADPRFAALKADLAARLARLRVCAGAACSRGPDLRLQARYRRGRAGCVRSRLRLRVIGSAASRIAGVSFYRGRVRIRRDSKAPYTASIARRRLRTRTLVQALVTLRDSRSASLDRAFRACG